MPFIHILVRPKCHCANSVKHCSIYFFILIIFSLTYFLESKISFGFHYYLHKGSREWVTNFLVEWFGGGFT